MLGVVFATLDRTGRCSNGHPTDKVSAAVKYASVQLGGKGALVGDVHTRFEKEVNLGPMRTHLTCRFRHPNEQLLDTVSLSGSIGDIIYEATRNIVGPDQGSTNVQMAYSLPTGLQLMADTTATAKKLVLDRVSAFHVAGPFNVQPSWLLATRTLRLQLARGCRWTRCPFDFQTEVHTDSESGRRTSYELGYQKQILDGRHLRGRLLLPADVSGRQIWAEYRDEKIDKHGVWYAKATLPFSQEDRLASGLLRRVDFSLRRAWQW